MGEIIWSVASALLGGVAAVALHRWASERSVLERTIFASAIALAPTLMIVAWALLQAEGATTFFMSLDEFWIPIVFQISMILILALPVSWLVSRRKRTDRSLSSIFE
jgi:hypothetical protein